MKLLTVGLGLFGLCLAPWSLAATVVDIPNSYSLLLIDGKENKYLLSQSGEVSFSPGRHQLVLVFEANYSTQNDIRFVRGEPVVVNLTLPDAQTIRLTVPELYKEQHALQFVQSQPLQFKNTVTGEIIPHEQFILPKMAGFQLNRDYQQELKRLGRDFVPEK